MVTDAGDASMRRRASGGLERETGRVLEDAVVGDERDAEAERGGGDPSVGVVLALTEAVPDALAGDAKIGVEADQVTSGVHDFGPGDLDLHAPEAGGTPVSKESAVANLGDSLKRDELDAADEERL